MAWSPVTIVVITLALLSSPGPQVLTKMKQQGYEASNWPETEEMPPGGNGSWRDDLKKELSDIW